MEFSQNFGENLKKIRNEMNITRADMAKSCQISISAYGKYEKGERTPDFNVANALVLLHQVVPTFLITGRGPMFFSEMATVEDIIRGFKRDPGVQTLLQKILETEDDDKVNKLIDSIKKLL